MELQALLLSSVLPQDVVLNDIYNHLWRNKNVLTDDLKTAIIHDHFRLEKIVMKYYNDTSLSRKPSHDDYFLCWLENDLLGVLNDDMGFMDGLSENLQRECPGITRDWLLSCESVDDLPEKVYSVWKLMTNEKKAIMYERCNH
jgi:hypothetical protein